MANYELSKSELEVMKVFWNHDRPLAKSDIIEFAEDRTWKTSYLHILLRSLLQKQIIKEDGYTKTATNISRTFVPCVSCEEYVAGQIRCQAMKTEFSMPAIIASLIETSADIETLNEIEKIIRRKKDQMK